MRVVLLNPDADFFLEDSEIGLDPCFFSAGESVSEIRARLEASGAEAMLARLRPHFPGAVGYSVAERPGPAAEEFREFPDTPIVRSRARMWIDLRQDATWDEFALKLEEAGSKPAWVDGLTAVRKLPGATGHNVLGSVSRGLVLPSLGDVDLSRFRTGVREFVIDRLAEASGELALGCTGLELSETSLKWKAGDARARVVDPRRCRYGVWVFLTPKVARQLHFDPAAAGTKMPGFLGYRAQEEWTVFSRDPLHLPTIGNLRRATADLCVWGQVDGSFPRESDLFRLSILHQGPRLASLTDAQSIDSLNTVSELCLDTLRWGSFAVRSMRGRRVFEWREGSGAFVAGSIAYFPHCDGPVGRVVEQVERALKERVA